jgi:hypothetical protein
VRWFRYLARYEPPLRRWFEDTDGTWYRNCPLIAAERDEVLAWPLTTRGKFEILAELFAEWDETFRIGIQRKAELGRGEVPV